MLILRYCYTEMGVILGTAAQTGGEEPCDSGKAEVGVSPVGWRTNPEPAFKSALMAVKTSIRHNY